MIKITKNQVEYLLNGASKDDMRTNLQGIYFDVAHKVAVTTNGHIALTCPIETDEMENRYYTVDSFKLFLAGIKQLPKSLQSYAFEIVDGKIDVAGQVIILRSVDGQFPDYRAVLPKIEERQRQFTMSRDILENLIKASKEFDKNDKRITFCLAETENFADTSVTVFVGAYIVTGKL